MGEIMSSLALRFMHFWALALTVGPCKGKPLLFTETAAVSRAHLNVGECLKVALRGNATTGFSWEVVPGAESVVVQRGEADFTSEGSNIGAGGLYTFTFQGVAPGEVSLKLVYRRPWEKELAPLKTYELEVKVTE